MNEFASFAGVLVYSIGWAVCLLGGIGIGAAVTLWAIDRVIALTSMTNILAQFWLAKKFPNRFKG